MECLLCERYRRRNTEKHFIIQEQENMVFLFVLVENRKYVFSKECSYLKYFVT